MKNRASLREVAERAGVSMMTVSNVLRGRDGEVAAPTQDRVWQAVRDLDYVPVRTARQNSHIETRIVGIVPYQAHVRNSIDAETYRGVCDMSRQHGYDVLTLLREETAWMADRQMLRFLDRRCDGFLFVSPYQGEWEQVLTRLVAHQIPTVVCFRRDVPEGIGWVDADNNGIVQGAVAHLRERGHTQIAFFASPPSPADPDRLAHASQQPNFDDRERQIAFGEAMRAHDLNAFADCILTGMYPDWTGIAPETVTRIRDERITGVVCGSDLTALHLWTALEAGGLRVPDDISLIGVDNSAVAAQRGLTTSDFSFTEVGHQAMRLWLALVAAKGATLPANIVVPATMCPRASVAPPAF